VVAFAGVPWRPLAVAMAQPRLAFPLLLFATAVFTFATMETTLSLLCAARFHLTPSQIYWLFGFLGLTTTITQGGLIGRLARRINEPSLAAIGTALLVLGMAATPFTPPAWRLLLSLAAIAVGQGITSPVLASLISKSGAEHASGSVMGVSQSAGSLARILGPLWGGLAFERLGPGGPFVSTAALLALVLAVFGASGRLRLETPGPGAPPA
jgi:DHA1 family tetracycline resistance protein-like MFS transporter